MDPLIAPVLYSETITASDSVDLVPAPCRAVLVDVDEEQVQSGATVEVR